MLCAVWLQGPLTAKLTERGRSAAGSKIGKYWWSVNQQVHRMHNSVIEKKIGEWDLVLGSLMLSNSSV